MHLADLFEFATDSDPSRNYFLWDYPRPAPAEDKFRALNILLCSFDLVDALPRGYGIVDAIREDIGAFATVFGVKWDGMALAWEFYFYDYRRRNRSVSMTRVLDAIAPYHAARSAPPEYLPYFMFSVDIDPTPCGVTGVRPLEAIHAYIGNPGSTVSSGISYGVRPEGIVLENFYFFFDAVAQRKEAADEIRSSPFFDETRDSIDVVLLPSLVSCLTICVANKTTHDCVYFSGVSVDQLHGFLLEMEYPQSLVDFVGDNRNNFRHLLFDVGFDYRFDNGMMRRIKSGFYGVF